MEQEKQLHWFPGHMMKATKAIINKLAVIDIVIEILDARAPLITSNNDLEFLIKNKKRIVVLNKVDRADPEVTKLWIKQFNEKRINVITTNSLRNNLKSEILSLIDQILVTDVAKQKSKGIKQPQFKILVIGLPNVGKSTFINNLLHYKVTKTADMPGVTRGQQWVKLNNYIHLLDTPGILPPKISKEEDKLILAIIKSLPAKHLFLELIANYLLKFLILNYPQLLTKAYEIPFKQKNVDELSIAEFYLALGEKYHFKISNNEINIARAMSLLINDVQTAKIGLISFEKPKNE